MLISFVEGPFCVVAAGPCARGRFKARELPREPMEGTAGSSDEEDLPPRLNNALRETASPRSQRRAVNGRFT
jgi:hypothetical protein